MTPFSSANLMTLSTYESNFLRAYLISGESSEKLRALKKLVHRRVSSQSKIKTTNKERLTMLILFSRLGLHNTHIHELIDVPLPNLFS